MISNLSAYNAWKRSTLDRLSGKYKSRMALVLNNQVDVWAPQMRDALTAGRLTFSMPDLHLKQDLSSVFLNHQHDAVYIAISDGIREMSPKQKLSSWEKWPVDYPVEATFTNLAEKKQRDDIAAKVFKRIRKKNHSYLGTIIDLEIERYKRNVTAVFQGIAEQYFKDPENTTPRDVFTDLISRIFQKNESQSEMIFRTETTRYFNDARLAYFKENTDVDFVQIVAVTDGRISNICEARDGYVIPIAHAQEKKYRPPFHPNCRSVQSPLDTDISSDAETVKRNLGSEFGVVHSSTSDKDFRGARSVPTVPLPKGWA